MASWRHRVQAILFIIGIYSIYSQEQVNGEWGDWRPLTLCSAKSCNCTGDVLNVTECETGKQVLIRHCDNPRPSNGGKWCQGVPLKKKDDCINLGTCPGWCPWTVPLWERNKHRVKCLTDNDRDMDERPTFSRKRERSCTCPTPIHERDGEICTAAAAQNADEPYTDKATGNWQQAEVIDATEDQEGFEALPNCAITTTLETTTTTTTTTTRATTTPSEECDYYDEDAACNQGGDEGTADGNAGGVTPCEGFDCDGEEEVDGDPVQSTTVGGPVQSTSVDYDYDTW